MTNRNKYSGFTLVEILLALLLSSILVLALQAAFRQMRFAITRTETDEPQYRQARRWATLWREEFSGVYLPAKDEQQENQKRFTLSNESDGTLQLSYFTLTPAWQQESSYAKGAKVEYRLTRNEQTEAFTLSRTQQAAAGSKVLGPETQDLLATNIKALSFSAYNQEQRKWENYFDAENQLPQAMRVTFEMARADEETSLKFVTDFFIPTRKSETN